MIARLFELIGIHDELAANVDQVQWSWTRPWWLLLLVPVLVVSVVIVRRHNRRLPHVSPLPRHMLSASRIALLVLSVVILAGPIARLTETVTRRPVVAIVVDASASMALPAGPWANQRMPALARATGLDVPENASSPAPDDGEVRKALNRMRRIDLAAAVLHGASPSLLAPLRERFDVRGYRFARATTAWDPATPPGLGTDPDAAPAGASGTDAENDPPPSAHATALGSAMAHVLDETAGSKLAAIVLLSDGMSNHGPDPVPWMAAAGLPVPIWSVPVGPREPVTDVALVDVLAPAQVAVGDTAAIIATCESHGLSGKEIVVKLVRKERTIDEGRLLLRGGQQQVELGFTPETADVGQAMLAVVIEPHPEDRVEQNNRHVVSVQVSEQRYRVLYVEGAPRWDFRFLDHALRRDSGLEVTLIVEAQFAAAPEKAAEAGLPQDAEAFAAFHTVILGDVSPALLTPRVTEQLRRAVEEEGVGLVVHAGPAQMPHAFADGVLADLLPVDCRGAGRMAPAFAPFRMAVTAEGSLHPAFRLYDDASKNRSMWNSMPRFLWAAATDRPRAGATVLAAFEEQRRPLIAEHRCGRGRVLFVGTDSTFLWRRNIGEHLFYRFWGQAIRHVARGRQRSGEGSWMRVRPPRIELGEAVTIEVHAVAGDGAAADVPRIDVATSGEGGGVVGLAPTGQKGLYRGTWRPNRPGMGRITYIDAQGTRLSTDVDVGRTAREWRRPSVNRELLGRLADASGGGLLEPEELDALPRVLEGGPRDSTEQIEDELWDNWLVLVVLIGIYCTDVGIRRVLGLS